MRTTKTCKVGAVMHSLYLCADCLPVSALLNTFSHFVALKDVQNELASAKSELASLREQVAILMQAHKSQAA